jgi:hypothetical protein
VATSNLLRSAFSQNARPIKTTKVNTSLAKELSFTISPHAYRLGSPLAARFPHDRELYLSNQPLAFDPSFNQAAALASSVVRLLAARRTKASAIARTTSHGNEAGTGITLSPAGLLGLRWARWENAAVLADGWSEGGADSARAALDAYWRRISRAAAFSPLQRSPLGQWAARNSCCSYDERR